MFDELIKFNWGMQSPVRLSEAIIAIGFSLVASIAAYLMYQLFYGSRYIGAGVHRTFIIVFAALGIQWLTRNRLTLFGRGNLMISVDKSSFSGLEAKLIAFLQKRLRGLRLETMSVIKNRVSLHYQYRRRTPFDWTAFTNDLNKLADSAKIEIFIG